MRRIGDNYRLSASDLMRFKVCRHAITLDRRRLEGEALTPAADSAEAKLVQDQGDAHEAAYLARCRDAGRQVTEIEKDGLTLEESVARTTAAMEAGAEIIFQGAFLSEPWGGYSDFLERVERPSARWGWSYEVVDTKLKRSADPKHILQLALYSDLVAEIQGTRPAAAHLELGNGERFTVQLNQVSAYARRARGRLERFLVARPETWPEPVSFCNLCPWREHCAAEWDAADSLVLVANINRSQRDKLAAAGVTTIVELAEREAPVPKLAPETLARLKVQARLQGARRRGGEAAFELRPHEAGRGFDLLPVADEGDLFYDIEGDPYYPGGLEYLHGVWYRGEGDWRFRAFWAHDRAAEGQAIDDLLGFFAAHLKAHPKAHIYHYANYEIAALKRLAMAHRLGEAVLDQLLRERRFVDLFKVVGGALIASEPGYSIKNLEAFYMAKRKSEVATAGASVVVYEEWRESRDQTLLDQIEDYNRTDCVSTQLLRDWLISAARPASHPWPDLATDARATGVGRIEADLDAQSELYESFAPARARLGKTVADLLFDLNAFHAREDKPAYWKIFDALARDSEDLIDDLACVGGLEAAGPPVPDKRSFERVYSFPPQETRLRAGDRPCIKPAQKPEAVKLVAIDPGAGTATLRRGAKEPLPDRLDLLPAQPLRTDKVREAVTAVSRSIIADDGRYRAIEDLLTRAVPRLRRRQPGARIVSPEADLLTETSAAIAAMDDSVLAIQGPPGTGKTFVSAHAIMDLVAAGKRIAVASHSHKAIANLLKACADRAQELGLRPRIVHKGGDEDEVAAGHGLISLTDDNEAPEIRTAAIVGGTAWLFARIEEPIFDYLVVDEAGQVALANMVAMGRAARNIVLVGDPMQLSQPTKGDHPGDSGMSALAYLLGAARIVPAERGIFMPVSRRMHPEVCRFISHAVYEGQLASHLSAGLQSLLVAGVESCGARFEPVEHEGCSQHCPEEIEAIRGAIDRLKGSPYRDREGRERGIGDADFLVVAPYNAQVNALRLALPGIRVGTVDKFQGQEAPICLISMTTSSIEEMPRDISFLFSLNRINVAVSRAQAHAILFASPRLLEVPCRTVDDMTLANTLCLLAEMGGDSF